MALSWSDVDVVVFRRSRGNGGQHQNKTATAVRMTHRASGVRVECCSERSLKANKEQAFALLKARLVRMAEEAAAAGRKAVWASKPDASFGSQVRTYHFPARQVTDHRTGHVDDPERVVRRGRLDGLIRSFLAMR